MSQNQEIKITETDLTKLLQAEDPNRESSQGDRHGIEFVTSAGGGKDKCPSRA